MIYDKDVNYIKNYVLKGDWDGYKSYLGNLQSVLYSKLKARNAYYRKLDELLGSTSLKIRILGLVLTLPMWLGVVLIYLLFKNEALRGMSFGLSFLVSLYIPMFYIHLKENKKFSTKYLIITFPLLIVINFVKHIIYVLLIIIVNIKKYRRQRFNEFAYIFGAIRYIYVSAGFLIVVLVGLLRLLNEKNYLNEQIFAMIPYILTLVLAVAMSIGFERRLLYSFDVSFKSSFHVAIFWGNVILAYDLFVSNLYNSPLRIFLEELFLTLLFASYIFFAALFFSKLHFPCYACGRKIGVD